MTKYRVHLMTDLTRLDEDGLADLLERLVEVGGVPTVPFGVLEVTGSTKAEDAVRPSRMWGGCSSAPCRR